MLATWRLLTNLPADVDDSTVALWYYWRWSIEKYFKLLKSAGMNVEHWQQATAHAIAARLLVASMACVTVWRLAQEFTPSSRERSAVLGPSQRPSNETLSTLDDARHARGGCGTSWP